MSTGFDVQISRLAVQLQELRQIRNSASAPFFDQSGSVSRLKRICDERERLSKSGLLNWRLNLTQTEGGWGQSEEKGDLSSSESEEQDLSTSYSDIAYMLQSDHQASHSHSNRRNKSKSPHSVELIQTEHSEHSSQSELVRHVRKQSDARLQATFKLLSESIEEAGNLRALLEYSLDADKIDLLLSTAELSQSTSSRLHRSGGHLNRTDNKHNATDLLRDLKHRALLLEQGNLLDQVCSFLFLLNC